MPEYLDVVNENDRILFRRPRSECLERGLLHRAIIVFLTNSRGEIYLQKRAGNLWFYPGRWTASCSGHVSAGESDLDGARREVKEELGIECELKELGKFITPKWKLKKGAEWEYITVYEGTSDSKITLSDESEEGRFVSPEEFKRLVASERNTFTPDMLLALEFYRGAG